MKKNKFVYVFITSIFGDTWIGKTTKKIKVDNKKCFATFEKAQEVLKDRFLEKHPAFDEDNEEDELYFDWEKISEKTESEVEIVSNAMLKEFF